MVRVAVLQSNYLPWKGYFEIIDSVDVFVFYDTVQYTKNDWRNRNVVATSSGKQWLTLPVRVESLQQQINETQVSHPKWAKKHWRTLQSTYGRAPFFDYAAPQLRSTYCDLASTTQLSTINQRLVREISAVLDLQTAFRRAEDFALRGDRNERLVQICREVGATVYVSGNAAKNYLDVEAFASVGVGVDWFDYGPYAPYSQLGPVFHHDVSVVDLLFNLGPAATGHLRGTSDAADY